MTKRKISSTSLEAYKRADEIIEPHHKLIIGALRILKSATSEQIATRLKLDKTQISRRTSELEDEKYIFKNGDERKTLANRNAKVYELTEKGLICDIGQIIMPTPTVVEKIRQKKGFHYETGKLFD